MHPVFAAGCIAALLLSGAALAVAEPRALPPVLATAAFAVAFSGTVLAALFT